MNKEEEVTFDKLPETVATILREIYKIRDLVEKDREPIQKRKPIGIKEACLILQKALPTVYALARKNQIPCSKIHGKLYFFEEQLLNYIDEGRRKTSKEIIAEIEAETQTNKTKRPNRRS